MFLGYNSTLGSKSREDLKTAWKYLSNEYKFAIQDSNNFWGTNFYPAQEEQFIFTPSSFFKQKLTHMLTKSSPIFEN